MLKLDLVVFQDSRDSYVTWDPHCQLYHQLLLKEEHFRATIF